MAERRRRAENAGVRPRPDFDFLSLAEAAKWYGVGQTTLYRLLSEGKLKRYQREGDKRTWLKVDELEERLRPRLKH